MQGGAEDLQGNLPVSPSQPSGFFDPAATKGLQAPRRDEVRLT